VIGILVPYLETAKVSKPTGRNQKYGREYGKGICAFMTLPPKLNKPNKHIERKIIC
jgi:hypothetical protein